MALPFPMLASTKDAAELAARASGEDISTPTPAARPIRAPSRALRHRGWAMPVCLVAPAQMPPGCDSFSDFMIVVLQGVVRLHGPSRAIRGNVDEEEYAYRFRRSPDGSFA